LLKSKILIAETEQKGFKDVVESLKEDSIAFKVNLEFSHKQYHINLLQILRKKKLLNKINKEEAQP